jgi:HSP20 family protein
MSEKKQTDERNVTTQERGGTTEGRGEQAQALQTGDAGRQQQAGLARGGGFDSFFGGGPTAFMQRFRDEMDKLFEDFGFGRNWLAPWSERQGSLWPRGFGEAGRSLWSPQVEVFERAGRLVVRADLPGLKKEDVKVEITDDALVISGERKSEFEDNREGYYRSERSYGSFLRRVPLPEGVAADAADATFRNGVLEVTMQAPQRQSRSRQIEITDGGEQSARGQAAGNNR